MSESERGTKATAKWMLKNSNEQRLRAKIAALDTLPKVQAWVAVMNGMDVPDTKEWVYAELRERAMQIRQEN